MKDRPEGGVNEGDATGEEMVNVADAMAESVIPFLNAAAMIVEFNEIEIVPE